MTEVIQTRVTVEEAAVLQSYPPSFLVSAQSVAGGDRAVRPVDAPALTVTQTTDRARWAEERPASTVVGTRRSEGGLLIGRQLEDDSRRDVGGKQSSVGLAGDQLAGVRVTGAEAGILQAFPDGFRWMGPKTKQYMQIGNAVPPLQAQVVFEALWADGPRVTAARDELGLAA